MPLPPSLSSLLPLIIGAAALAAGCTFEPPDSVLGVESMGEDGSGNGGGNGGGGGGGGGGDDGVGGPDAGTANAQGESMSITFTTALKSGAYGTNNVVATWIEDADGNYVATIDRQSAARTKNLVAWVAMAPNGIQNVDSLSGATRLNHNAPVTATWEIPADLADGIYTIRIETCDENSVTEDQNNQGSFTFEKNGTASNQPGLTGPGYSKVTIDYSGTP